MWWQCPECKRRYTVHILFCTAESCFNKMVRLVKEFDKSA